MVVPDRLTAVLAPDEAGAPKVEVCAVRTPAPARGFAGPPNAVVIFDEVLDPITGVIVVITLSAVYKAVRPTTFQTTGSRHRRIRAGPLK